MSPLSPLFHGSESPSVAVSCSTSSSFNSFLFFFYSLTPCGFSFMGVLDAHSPFPQLAATIFPVSYDSYRLIQHNITTILYPSYFLASTE